jgi:undecaprenyl-diphosphatase
MEYWQVAILALIQGAAELLPISSSAHVILAEKLMKLDPSDPKNTFLLVMLHTGTMFAVLVYFWPRWRALFQAQSADGNEEAPLSGRRFLTFVVVATAVTGALGLMLKVLIEKVILERLLGHPEGEVRNLFKELPLIGAALLVAGILIVIAGRRRTDGNAGTLDKRSSIWIGLVQALCLPFRGFSRSGATISTALLCRVPRALAEDFSFALAVVLTPPVLVLELHHLHKASATQQVALTELMLPGLVGMALAFVAGLAALRFLSAVLERGRWQFFGYYCMAAAAVVFVADQLMAVFSGQPR